ncbi:calcium/sodium antiporter [Pseudaestuariivita atlantica]|uniref:Sodium:proton exchanger n=1 Tax=Pseudaestuariivita atlantica TaxID=1317121 RepID=A0A0L1JTE6_9RHOB|nr:calcium/sodium antiporter [Pseudaestuariivita atlantica]KNG95044.1 sodium:proton exchanger [Pseudaestuariivita atlantica]
MVPWLLAGLGLGVLVLAGDALVKGAVNLSLRLGIPALIVSLTVVAFGTSAPELLIAINAVIGNAPGIAMGNVVGSNTANALLVLGLPAMFAALHTADTDARKSYLQMMAATVLFIALAFAGVFAWWSGLILLGGLALYIGSALRAARRHRRARKNGNGDNDDLDGADPSMPGLKIAMYLVAGLVGLPLGADLLVDNASIIARTFGISDTAIGLTLVALGTSLPELATTVMAALRRQADVALGSVIGSNMFNLLAIIGVASLIGAIPVDRAFLTFDLWVMLAASVMLVPFVFFGQPVTRIWGAGLTAIYLTYVWVVLS